MNSIEKTLEAIVNEGIYISKLGDAAEYNFMRAANRSMRKMEEMHGSKCVPIVIKTILDKSIDGPSIRVMISSLLRLVPTRQTAYENILTSIFPSWQSFLEGNPQTALPVEFQIASEKVKYKKIKYPTGLIDALIKATSSKYPDVVVTACKALEKTGEPETISAVNALTKSNNEKVRISAIIAVSRLSALDEGTNQSILEIVANKKHSIDERIAALEGVHANLPTINYAIDFFKKTTLNESYGIALLDHFLDSFSDELLPIIEDQLKGFEVEKLPQATLRRIARVQKISKTTHELALKALRTSAKKTEKQSGNRSKFGLIAHRSSNASGAWVGHAGIFVSEDTLIHATTGHDPHAVRLVSFAEWLAGGECWGIREDANHQVDLVKAVNRAYEIASWRTEYDGTHNNQSGRWIKGWFCRPKYWETDCVGFTEHCYEYSGGDPTPNEFQQGAGWPLTVREQRDHMRLVMPC